MWGMSALTLLVQHVPVHLAGGQVGVLVQVLVDEALVVAQVQVGLGAVVGDEHLTVLQGAHGAGVHVDVGVQLLAGHLQAAALEQAAQRGGGDALAQAGHDTAGDEDILGLLFCHKNTSSSIKIRSNQIQNTFSQSSIIHPHPHKNQGFPARSRCGRGGCPWPAFQCGGGPRPR